MVFFYNEAFSLGTGAAVLRSTGKYTGQLIFESICGVFVAIANSIVGFTMIIGWKRLKKNKFYIILANLLICTALKCFIEIAFIIPYYVLQSDGIRKEFGYFTANYLNLIFNISVFADYGVLFFSMHIAVNRFLNVRQSKETVSVSQQAGIETALSCALVWIITSIIPVIFYMFNCQYNYNSESKIYYNQCFTNKLELSVFLLYCLIYLSYACTAVVFVLYLLIYWALRKRLFSTDFAELRSSMSITQKQLLQQSVVVFVLYAASILSVLLMHFVPVGWIFDIFDIAYIENLLNLSIAAVYPICFLTMSGEMKSILARSIFSRRWLSSSIRVSSNSA